MAKPLDRTFSRASAILGENEEWERNYLNEKPVGMSGETRENILSTLKGCDDSRVIDKAKYLANLRLAGKLFPDSKKWSLSQWEQFVENHPDPIGELDELTTQSNK